MARLSKATSRTPLGVTEVQSLPLSAVGVLVPFVYGVVPFENGSGPLLAAWLSVAPRLMVADLGRLCGAECPLGSK